MKFILLRGLTILIAAFTTLELAAAGPLGGLIREISAFLAFAPQNTLRHYFKMQHADQTFKGLYHWNLFDACMLLPYFAVMIRCPSTACTATRCATSTSSTKRTTIPTRRGISTSCRASRCNCPSSTSSSSSTA